jgi:mono/diheme cytochrome c family protein
MAQVDPKDECQRDSRQEVEMSRSLLALAVVVAVAVLTVPLAGEAQRDEPGPQDWWGPRTPDWERMWPGDVQRDRWAPGRMGVTQNQRMLRHWTFMNEGVPEAYRGAASTVEPTPETIARGADLYAARCAECHGAIGYGDGTEGLGLVPSPALLTYLVQRPMAGDEYLLWAITEGGDTFGTEMPAYKNALIEDDIWSIIAFMRSGFAVPAVD